MNKTRLTTSLLLGITIVGFMPIQAFATPQIDENLSNQEKIQILDDEIIKATTSLTDVENTITLKEEKLNTQYKELVKTAEQYQEQKNNLTNSANSSSKNNSLKLIDNILGSSSISEFFQNIELSKQIIKESNRTIKQLSQKQESLEQQQVEIKEELSKLSKQKDQLAVQKEELEKKKEDTLAEIERLAQLEASKPQTNVITPVYDENASEKANAVIAEAYKYLGTPYVWGGTTPSGFDCSGYMQYIFKSVGVSLPRVSQSQQNAGQRVSISDIKPGDLVFWGNPAYHVGMYIGNGQYIHAPQTGDVIKISPLNINKVSSVVRVI